jgi:hypothetical protein
VRTPRPILATILAGLLAGYLGTVLSLVSSPKVGTALTLGIVLTLMAAFLAVVLELYFRQSATEPVAQIILGPGALMDKYEDMRRTRGRTAIYAVWSTPYPRAEVEAYFRAEAADFASDSGLTIDRLIADGILDSSLRTRLTEIMPGSERYKLATTDLTGFELYLCEFVRDRTPQMKAVVVFNDVLTRTPVFGVSLDSERYPELRSFGYTLKHWFDSLPRNETIL